MKAPDYYDKEGLHDYCVVRQYTACSWGNEKLIAWDLEIEILQELVAFVSFYFCHIFFNLLFFIFLADQ